MVNLNNIIQLSAEQYIYLEKNKTKKLKDSIRRNPFECVVSNDKMDKKLTGLTKKSGFRNRIYRIRRF